MNRFHRFPLPGLAAILSLVSFASTATAQIYVDASNTNPVQNGASWGMAYNNLDDAIVEADNLPTGSRVIWVRVGTYHPATVTIPNDPHSATFSLPENTRLYGGFAGTEFNLDQRPGNLFNATILDGSTPAAQPGVRHVVTCERTTVKALEPHRTEIDGFSIRSGWAIAGSSSAANENNGGAILSSGTSLVVRNCTFDNNLAFESGGAIYWERGTQPVGGMGLAVTRSIFVNNKGLLRGGAVCALEAGGIPGYGIVITTGGSKSQFFGCIFDGNMAGRSDDHDTWEGQGGGAVYSYHSEIVYGGNVFSRNEAKGNGSAVKMDWDYSGGSTGLQPFFDSNTVHGNKVNSMPPASSVGFDVDAAPVYSQKEPVGPDLLTINLKNNIVWGNTGSTKPTSGGFAMFFIGNLFPATDMYEVESSDIQISPSNLVWPGPPGVPANSPLLNINENPQFISPSLGDFRVAASSPCRNSGQWINGFTPDLGDLDRDGNWGLQSIPHAVNLPSAFFYGFGLGTPRVQGSLDMGAMEVQ